MCLVLGEAESITAHTVCKWKVPGSLQRSGFHSVTATVLTEHLRKPNGGANKRHI